MSELISLLESDIVTLGLGGSDARYKARMSQIFLFPIRAISVVLAVLAWAF